MFDFNFTFGVAIGLIMALLGTHYYFRDKINNYWEHKKDEYSKGMAEAQVDSIRQIIEKTQYQTTSSYDELKTVYY